ncbi:hypothetical protein CYY_001311 [Polysphondylium violaceum]|uniref:Uncharacterized protein n=1 Tax=Polysphondylium violaceum TaxID=133409 RepID=A0A8J4V4A9_9MYCE|nr:hypothetical protein CYY_001311 [Polysphondylium violaceum]
MSIKLLLTLFVLFTISKLSFAQSNPQNVAIWNQNNTLIVGLCDMFDGEACVAKLSLPGLNYLQGNISSQLSTLNYNTNVLTLTAKDSSNNLLILSVDCNKWKVVGKNAVDKFTNYLGFSSDQSSSNKIFASKQDDQALYVLALNPFSASIQIFDWVFGLYRGSVFDPINQNYFVAHKNNTGLFITIYDINFNIVADKLISFTGASVVDQPLKLTYCPVSQTIVAIVQLYYIPGRNQFALAKLDWAYGTFDVTSMVGVQNDIFLFNVADSASDIVYTFAKPNAKDTFIYTWDLTEGTQTQYTAYDKPLLAAF